MGRIGEVAASSESLASKSSRAMELRPLTVLERKWRRSRRPRPVNEGVFMKLFDEKEFVRVQQRTAERWKTVLLDEFERTSGFRRFGGTCVGEFVRGGDLFGNITSSFAGGTGGQLFGLLDEEGAVEEVQRLQWRGGA